jgi:hypothetical protein
MMTNGVGDFYLTAKSVNDSFIKSGHVRRYWDRTPSLNPAQRFKYRNSSTDLIDTPIFFLHISAGDEFRNFLRLICLICLYDR